MKLTSLFAQKAGQGVAWFLLLAGAGFSLSAYAVSVTLTYSGVVSRLAYLECQSPDTQNCNWNITYPHASNFVNGKSVAVGDRFAGGFTYQADAPLTGMSADGFQAIHLHSVYDVIFESGEVAVPTSSLPHYEGSFSVINDRPSSGFAHDMFFLQSNFFASDWFASVGLYLLDGTGTALDSFEVPLALDLSDFNGSSFQAAFLRRSDGDQLHIHGTLTSVIFSPQSDLPEPTSIALLLIGVTGVVGVTRAREHILVRRRT